jgi:hypothetical protein
MELAVGRVEMSNLGHERIRRIWISYQRGNGEKDL